jgi:hypothetical protein
MHAVSSLDYCLAMVSCSMFVSRVRISTHAYVNPARSVVIACIVPLYTHQQQQQRQALDSIVMLVTQIPGLMAFLSWTHNVHQLSGLLAASGQRNDVYTRVVSHTCDNFNHLRSSFDTLITNMCVMQLES